MPGLFFFQSIAAPNCGTVWLGWIYMPLKLRARLIVRNCRTLPSFLRRKGWSRFLFACSHAAHATRPELPWHDARRIKMDVIRNTGLMGVSNPCCTKHFGGRGEGCTMSCSRPVHTAKNWRHRARRLGGGWCLPPLQMAGQKNPLLFSVEKTRKLICFTPKKRARKSIGQMTWT